MNDKDNHLPLFGVGPFLIFPIIIATATVILLSYYNMIPAFKSNGLIMAVIGIVLITLGIIFWLLAVLNSRIDKNIKSNKLVTTGIYALVRHTIYAAFLYAVTGLTFISNNLYLLILPVICWLILTIAMMKTEEKWLSINSVRVMPSIQEMYQDLFRS